MILSTVYTRVMPLHTGPSRGAGAGAAAATFTCASFTIPFTSMIWGGRYARGRGGIDLPSGWVETGGGDRDRGGVVERVFSSF